MWGSDRRTVVMMPGAMPAPVVPVDSALAADVAELLALMRRHLVTGNGGLVDDVTTLRRLAERDRRPSGKRGESW